MDVKLVIKTVTQSVSDDYRSGKITIEEAARILFKHGFLNFANDLDRAMWYINRY